MMNKLLEFIRNKENICCILDLETTGLYPQKDEIIEVYIIKLKNQEIIDEYHSYVCCSQPISEETNRLTGIDDKTLKNYGKDLCIVLQEIKKFIGNYPLVIHYGIKFDIPFLNFYYSKNNMPIIKNYIFDTVDISRKIDPFHKKHTLKEVAKRLNINYSEEQAHSAKYDVNLLYQV